MADVRMRKVDCIVVKDLSRFGRNHLETGNYLGKVFPFLGVRFIAVNDHFDSMEGDPETLSVQLKNLVNELYAKDIAVKVRSSKMKQFEKGSFIGGQPVYGYDAVKEDGRRVLAVNREAAAVVREVFDRFLRGDSMRELVSWLYEERIHRPGDFRKYGHVCQMEGEELHSWDKTTLAQMLNNCTYIGYLLLKQKDGEHVRGRVSSMALNGELKVKENNHEPIIPEELFFGVVRQYEKRSEKYAARSSRDMEPEEDAYKDLLYCGLCGSKYIRRGECIKLKAGRSMAYRYYCANRKHVDGRKCDSGDISLLALNRLVREAIAREFAFSSFRQKDLVTVSRQRADQEKKRLEAELRAAEERAGELKESGSREYIRYRNGELTEQEMRALARQRKLELERLAERQKELERQLAETDREAGKREHFLRMLLKGNKDMPLSSDVVHELIERIEVFPDKRVVIHFAYSGRDLERILKG